MKRLWRRLICAVLGHQWRAVRRSNPALICARCGAVGPLPYRVTKETS